VSNKKNDYIKTLTCGDSFGEQSLFYNCKRLVTCVCDSEKVTCLVLGRQTLRNTLGDKIQIILFKNKHVKAFSNDPKLGQLTKVQLTKIADYTDTTMRRKGAKVYMKG
jgi:CRP-like cAMP-binding protein